MAATTKKNKKPSKRMWLVDPIYRRFTAAAFKQLTSGEFFEFFMGMLKNGEQQFQFSNRKIKIDVDDTWIDIIEDTIPAFMEITRNPRVIITQEELVTNVVQAKKIDSAVVRHLCAHSNLVDAVDEDGNVIPSKVLNIFKEETWDTYENRFVYSLLKKTYEFVAKRYQDMQEALNDEFGATLLIDATGSSKMETLEVHSSMRIKQKEDWSDGDDKSVFARVKYLYESLGKLMETRFAKEMKKYQLVRPPLVPTNAIKKNPFLRKCTKLWDFLLVYAEAGFSVEIIEQNPEINQKFEQDIFDNIMFTYIILKGYLEDNRDRALDRNIKARRRTLKPKYIRQIIEETVENFNLSEVEVRKIMIEELTKEQLLREEREERYRIIEEQRRLEEEKRRAAEMERIRVQKEKEREAQLRAREREKERARKQREKAREALRKAKEKEKKAAMDAKRLVFIEDELRRQMESIERTRLVKLKKENPEEYAAKMQLLEKSNPAKASANKTSKAKTSAKKSTGTVETKFNPRDLVMDFGANRSEAEMMQYNKDMKQANPVIKEKKPEKPVQSENDGKIPGLEEMTRIEVNGSQIVMYKDTDKDLKPEDIMEVQKEDAKKKPEKSGIGRFNPFKRGDKR